MDLFLVENRFRVGNQKVINSLAAKMPKRGFPLGPAPGGEGCAGRPAVQVDRELKPAAPSLTNRSQAGAEFGEPRGLFKLKDRVHIGVVFEQFTKPALNHHRYVKV